MLSSARQACAGTDALCVGQPLESIMPIINNPTINTSKPLAVEVLAKVSSPQQHSHEGPLRLRASSMDVQAKAILMAVYFAADHVVWAGQAGIYTNKESLERCAQLVAAA